MKPFRWQLIASVLWGVCVTSIHAAPGGWDSSYAPVLNGPVYAMAIQADGKALIGGAFTSVNNSFSRAHLARLFADGSLDTSFLNSGSGIQGTVWCLLIQTDGRIVVGGDITSINGTVRNRIARLNVNGTVDGTFIPTNTFGNSVFAVAAQSDGKLIIGGSFSGQNFPSWIARLNADGTLDSSFSAILNGPVNAIAVKGNDKILIGGGFTQVNGASRGRIARINADGSLDNLFQNGSAGVSGTVRSMLIQPDGKLLIGGDFSTVNNVTRLFAARLNGDGGLDTSFNSSPGPNAPVYALTTQPDNNVLIGGLFSSFGPSSISRVARLYPDGSRDTSFTTFGINNIVQAVALQSDGGILVGGTFTTINNSNRNYLGRLYGNLYPPEFIVQPASRATNVGATVKFSAQLSNPTASNFQWRKEGNNIPGATGTAYTLSNVQFADAGNYSVFASNGSGGTTSSNATLDVGIAPVITAQPASLILTQGQTATFAIGATGTPLRYYWKKYGAFIPSATNSSFTIASVVNADAAIYTCQVSNFVASVTSTGATLSIYGPPVITAQPISKIVTVGAAFSLSVVAGGTPVPACQWTKDGQEISGASATVFSVNAAQTNDTGAYAAVLTNIFGAVTSAVAQVNVGFAPLITRQPKSFTNNLGTSNAFTVAVSGSEPLLYQWFKDGAAIVDATNNLLSLPNLQSNQVGLYSVTVTNLYGWAVSTSAFLTIPGINSFDVGLLAYYPFNGNANDATAHNNNGIPTNCQTAGDRFGHPASAYSFNGVDSLITAPDQPYLNLSSPSNFTISVWATRSASQTSSFILGKDAGNRAPPSTKWILILGRYHDPTTPTLTFHYIDENNALHWIGASSIVDDSDVWHQYVVSRSGALYSIYQDGNLIETDSDSGTVPSSNPAPLTIGNAEGAGWHAGLIDDIRIYNRGLSSNEVAQLYALEADVPVITSQPQPRIVTEGAPVTFNVAATAQNPLSFQWQKDSIPIPNATNDTLLLPNVKLSESGFYSVAISNGFAGMLSTPAALSVMSPVSFLSNQFGFTFNGPAGVTVTVESSTNLIDWQPVFTNTVSSFPILFLDPGSTTNALGFYRVQTD